MARKKNGSIVERNTVVTVENPLETLTTTPVDEEYVSLNDTPKSANVNGDFVDMLNDVVVLDGGDGYSTPPIEAATHSENLVRYLSPSQRAALGAQLTEMIEADEKSRAPWQKRAALALKAMGFGDEESKKESKRVEGLANITHPMLAEAAVQFNARAYPELMPPAGPVKAKVVGEDDDNAQERASRIEAHMNYQITEEDENYCDEMDALLMRLPIDGSAFKKTYYDHNCQHIVSKFIQASDVLIPYNATSLEDAQRYSIKLNLPQNEVLRRQLDGLYDNVDLPTPSDNASNTNSELKRITDRADGAQPDSNEREEDRYYNLHETYLNYDLAGFEHTDDKGKLTGLAIPYIMTFDKDTGEVLAIYRNWREGDTYYKPRQYLVHYKYLQGLGVYGLGLYHIIGGMAEACTGSINALLDSATFATLQGGFKAKDARLASGTITIRAGEWVDVDLSADELKNAFFTPPFKEPSMALFKLLEIMQDNGRRFAGTTENIVGDARNTGPVGTTVALIEQGSKVMSGIHRRLHRAQQREFSIRAELNAEFMPETNEWFYTNGGSNFVSKNDYASGNVKIIPVSDPNITSSTQRIAIAQGIMELAERAPQLYKLKQVHERVLKAMGVNDVDDIMTDPDKVQQFDAVSEGSRVRAGKPIKAFIHQNHDQHNALHQAQIEYFKAMPDQEQAQQFIFAMLDHMAKHDAYKMYNEISQMSAMTIGQPLPEIDLYADEAEPAMPNEVEAFVTEMAAMRVQDIQGFYQSRIPPPPQDEELQAKLQRDEAAFQKDEERKAISFDNEEKRKEASFVKEQARKSVNSKLNPKQSPKKPEMMPNVGN